MPVLAKKSSFQKNLIDKNVYDLIAKVIHKLMILHVGENLSRNVSRELRCAGTSSEENLTLSEHMKTWWREKRDYRCLTRVGFFLYSYWRKSWKRRRWEKQKIFLAMITTILICFIQSIFVCKDWCSSTVSRRAGVKKKSENIAEKVEKKTVQFVWKRGEKKNIFVKNFIFIKLVDFLKKIKKLESVRLWFCAKEKSAFNIYQKKRRKDLSCRRRHSLSRSFVVVLQLENVGYRFLMKIDFYVKERMKNFLFRIHNGKHIEFIWSNDLKNS